MISNMVDQTPLDIFVKILIAAGIYLTYVFLVALAAAYFYRAKPGVPGPSRQLIYEHTEPGRFPSHQRTRVTSRPVSINDFRSATGHEEVRRDKNPPFVNDVAFYAETLGIFVAALWAPPFLKILSTGQKLIGFEIMSGKDGALPPSFPNIQITADIVQLIALALLTLLLYFAILLLVVRYSMRIYYLLDSIVRLELNKWRSAQMQFMLIASILLAEGSVFLFHDLRLGEAVGVLLAGMLLILSSHGAISEFHDKISS